MCMNACGMCRCVCNGECITERNKLGEAEIIYKGIGNASREP